MATVSAYGSGNIANLANGQAGNGVSTNIAQRRGDSNQLRPSLLRIITVAGTTCTYLIEGSPDGSSWYPLPTQDITTAGPPGSLTSATFTITTSTTTWKLIPVDLPWAYVRITFSANTGITNTVDVFAY